VLLALHLGGDEVHLAPVVLHQKTERAEVISEQRGHEAHGLHVGGVRGDGLHRLLNAGAACTHLAINVDPLEAGFMQRIDADGVVEAPDPSTGPFDGIDNTWAKSFAVVLECRPLIIEKKCRVQLQ